MTGRWGRAALLCLVASGAVLLAARAGRAADCFAPLAEHDKWSCTASLSSGVQVSYCLNVTGTAGEGVERTFAMVATGPYPRVCTCGAKGKGARARFNATTSYLCFDQSTDTAEVGTITPRKPKLAGQTYNVSANVRSAFSCVPDPTCVVPLP